MQQSEHMQLHAQLSTLQVHELTFCTSGNQSKKKQMTLLNIIFYCLDKDFPLKASVLLNNASLLLTKTVSLHCY